VGGREERAGAEGGQEQRSMGGRGQRPEPEGGHRERAEGLRGGAPQPQPSGEIDHPEVSPSLVLPTQPKFG
jgi:hypothetical protein